MIKCTSPKGHEWSDQWWAEPDRVDQEWDWKFSGRWSQSVVTHFKGHTSQPVRCIHCEETGYRVSA